MPDRLILHVGASKCGSSALQASLTMSPVIEGKFGRVTYAVLHPYSIVVGSDVIPDPATRYLASTNARNLQSLDDSSLNKISKSLHSIDSSTIVMSNEGWILYPETLGRLIERIKFSIDIVIYIRPPIEFLNSGWWQWGAWSNLSLNDWLRKHIPLSKWSNFINRWNSIKNINNIIVRILPNNIVEDFGDIIGVGSLEQVDVNRGLPGVILRLYQRNRILRRGPHDSRIDFILSRIIDLDDPTPWVLDKDTMKWIVEETLESNKLLQRFLDDKSVADMNSDERWWSADAFSNRNLESWEPREIDPIKLERAVVDIIRRLYELEMDNNKNKNNLINR